jgi:hypothetical protein
VRIKLLQYNVQDLFLQLAYPVEAAHLSGLSEQHWQLVGATDVKLKPLAQLRGLASLWERGLLPSDHYPLVCTLDLG